MAETLYADPKAKEFDTYFKSQLALDKIFPNTSDVYDRALRASARIPQDSAIKPQTVSEKLRYPKRPDLAIAFAQLSFNPNATSDIEKFQLVSRYKHDNKAHAILILPLGHLKTAQLQTLSEFKRVTVMPQSAYDSTSITRRLKTVLGPEVVIDFYEPTARHAAPYSTGNKYISGFCDKLADQILENALKNKAVRHFVPQKLYQDVSLMVSDVIYRPVQRFYAALRAVEVCAADAPIFYMGPATSLPRTLARSRENPVFVMTHGTDVATDQDVLSGNIQKESRKQVVKDIRRTFKYLAARSFAASPKIDISGEHHIYLATNTHSSSYRQAVSLISESLGRLAPVSIFDYAAPIGFQKNVQASLTPCLHNALLSSRSSDITLISQYIHLDDMIAPENLALGLFPAYEMKELIVQALERDLGAIIGNILLFDKISERLSLASNAILIQCPGRFGNIRCIGHAFEKAGHPTLDVQALFVTEMARYRPPMAEHMAVIDSFSKDLYMNQWNIAKEKITPIGSVLLDQDINLALENDAASLKKDLLSGTQKKVITYASQPLPEAEILDAVKALISYMKEQKDTHLCVKLHPAQNQNTQDNIETLLKESLKDHTRFTLLKKTPFWQVMPFTDILISYFSNVCLMAPRFNTPVITLPTTVPIPAITLAHMGLAEHVTSFDKLGPVIDSHFSKTYKNFHSNYLIKNPHMTQMKSLTKLCQIVEKSLKKNSGRQD
ncbi:hypothetical protein N9M10_01450 [Hellea sp.]|nr:hypothetical protein [Hellea sp.]